MGDVNLILRPNIIRGVPDERTVLLVYLTLPASSWWVYACRTV